jgi:hypothetical protein
MDANSELGQFAVPAIGDRTKVVNDNAVTAINFREVPNIIFATSEEWEQSGSNSFSGYTPKRINGIDATKTVVFMSADELQELLTRFHPVAEAAKSSSRDVYQNAMVSMVRALTGHDDETIKNMAVKDVMQMVSGLNESTEALSIPLKDITDVRKVSPAKYQTMVSNFTRKYTKLHRIRTHPYDYTKIIDGVMYYWLPIEYLP